MSYMPPEATTGDGSYPYIHPMSGMQMCWVMTWWMIEDQIGKLLKQW